MVHFEVEKMRRANFSVMAMTLLACLFIFGPVGSPRAWAGSVTVLAAPPTVGDASVGPVVYWEEVLSSPRQVHLNILRIDLSNPGYEVTTLVQPFPDGFDNRGGDLNAGLINPKTLASNNDAIAAINANAFRYYWDPNNQAGVVPPGTNPGWVAGYPVHTFGLAVSDGVQLSANDTRRTPLWIDDQNRAHVGFPGPGDVVQQAIADWDAGEPGQLLKAGENVAISSSTYARSIVGTDSTGRWLYMAFVPKQTGYSGGLTLSEAADLLLARGVTDAINLDGGGSSMMLIDSGSGLNAVGNPPSGYLRPVPVVLAVRAIPEPAGLSLLALGALSLLARRRWIGAM